MIEARDVEMNTGRQGECTGKRISSIFDTLCRDLCREIVLLAFALCDEGVELLERGRIVVGLLGIGGLLQMLRHARSKKNQHVRR